MTIYTEEFDSNLAGYLNITENKIWKLMEKDIVQAVERN